MSAGKGDRPRKVDGKKYRDNYDYIYESKSHRNKARPQPSNSYPQTPKREPKDQ
jgi:hypothetical protein